MEAVLHQQHLLLGGPVGVQAREYGHLLCPVLGQVVDLGEDVCQHDGQVDTMGAQGEELTNMDKTLDKSSSMISDISSL